MIYACSLDLITKKRDGLNPNKEIHELIYNILKGKFLIIR
jgi:hypothetical protein